MFVCVFQTDLSIKDRSAGSKQGMIQMGLSVEGGPKREKQRKKKKVKKGEFAL